MNAEKWSIEFLDLSSEANDTLTRAIKSIKYVNYKSAVACGLSISFNKLMINELGKISKIFKRFAPFNLYVSKNGYVKKEVKGIVLKRKRVVKNQEFSIDIECSHSTYALTIQEMPSFETFNFANAGDTIRNVLIASKLNKTYDLLVMPARLSQELDSEAYSGSSQKVYDFITQILNDCSAKMFSSCYRIGGVDKQVLYIYDTGSYADTIEPNVIQYLSNNNVIEFEDDIDYRDFPDIIKIESDGGMDKGVDNGTSISVNSKSLNSLGFLNLNQRQNINIPEIIFTKKLKTKSSDRDSSDFANSFLRDSVNDGVIIDVKVPSFFVDIFNDANGVWVLGKKITITNNDLKLVLEEEFSNYLKNNSKYYFVISGFDYSYDEGGISCMLSLTPNDLMQTINTK